MKTSLLSSDPYITETIRQFARELIKFKSRVSLNDYWSSLTLELSVRLNQSPADTPKISTEIEFRGPNGSVSHIQLGPLMDEAYRRAGFNRSADVVKRAEAASLLSLEAPPASPQEEATQPTSNFLDDEIPF